MTSGREVARALRAAYLALHRQTNACFAKDGVTEQELVRRVGSDPNTVRAILLLLEGRGLVARAPPPADGRARRVTLTAKGRQVFKKLWAKSEPLRVRLLTAFRPDELTALVGLLRRVAEVMAPLASNG